MRSFQENLDFLAGLAEAAVESSRIRPGGKIAEAPANSLGKTLIKPGGGSCYPAVWIQDCAMALESGFITLAEALDYLRLVSSCQNGPVERKLKSGAAIPPYAIPDHILFNGEPVFFPGAYSSGENQGGEKWGLRPPVNNHYDFIAAAHWVWRSNGANAAFLRENIAGLPLLRRLELAFAAPETDAETELVVLEPSRRPVGFIFCDSVRMTGLHLFSSLLRRRAALQLLELKTACDGKAGRDARLERLARKIEKSVPEVFRDEKRFGGWLFAATGCCRQPDVWGTLKALCDGILPESVAQGALKEVVDALRDGKQIVYKGAVRHLPVKFNASPSSAWESSCAPFNCYQNGGYWHTATGWLVAALWKTRRELALNAFDGMMEFLRAEDFRKGGAFNAPYEWLDAKGEGHCPVFLASVATPYGILKSCRL